jgi:predicted transcriptional regulator
MIASVRRGIADAEAGRSISAEDAMQELRARADRLRQRSARDG